MQRDEMMLGFLERWVHYLPILQPHDAGQSDIKGSPVKAETQFITVSISVKRHSVM